MCDIRYFRLARHNFDVAKSALRDYQYDELFIRDVAYSLQQCVEKTLKAFLECKGVTVPQTHKISKLVRMSRDNGSAVIITSWIESNSVLLEAWEADSRYDLDFYAEIQTVQKAVEEVQKFLEVNGLTDVRDAEITDDIERQLRDFVPIEISTTFYLNVYYHVFKKKLQESAAWGCAREDMRGELKSLSCFSDET